MLDKEYDKIVGRSQVCAHPSATPMPPLPLPVFARRARCVPLLPAAYDARLFFTMLQAQLCTS